MKRDLTRALAAAEDQLGGYLAGRQDEHGSRYVGVLTDGLSWRAYNLPIERGDLQHVASFTLSTSDPDADALLVWLDGILATTQSIWPTPAEVHDRLGAGSSQTQLALVELADVYELCAYDPGVALERGEDPIRE